MMLCDTLKDGVFALVHARTEVWTPLRIPEDVELDGMESKAEGLSISSFGRMKQQDKLLTFRMSGEALVCENNEVVTAVLSKHELYYLMYTSFFDAASSSRLSIDTSCLLFKKFTVGVNPFRLGNLKIGSKGMSKMEYISACKTFVNTYSNNTDIPVSDSTGERLYNIIPPDAPDAEDLLQAALTHGTGVAEGENAPISAAQTKIKRRRRGVSTSSSGFVKPKTRDTGAEVVEETEASPDPSQLFLPVAGADAVQPCGNSIVTVEEKKIDIDEDELRRRRLNRIQGERIRAASKGSNISQDELNKLNEEQKALEAVDKASRGTVISKPKGVDLSKRTTQEPVSQPALVKKDLIAPVKPVEKRDSVETAPVEKQEPVIKSEPTPVEKQKSVVFEEAQKTTEVAVQQESAKSTEAQEAGKSTDLAVETKQETTAVVEQQTTKVEAKIGKPESPYIRTVNLGSDKRKEELGASDKPAVEAATKPTEPLTPIESVEVKLVVEPPKEAFTSNSDKPVEKSVKAADNFVADEKSQIRSDEIKAGSESAATPACEEHKQAAAVGEQRENTTSDLETFKTHHIYADKMLQESESNVVALPRDEHKRVADESKNLVGEVEQSETEERKTPIADVATAVADSWAGVTVAPATTVVERPCIYTPSKDTIGVTRLCSNGVGLEPTYNTLADFVLVAGRSPAENLQDFLENCEDYAVCWLDLKQVQEVSSPLRKYISNLIIQHSERKISSMLKLSLLSRQSGWCNGRLYFAHKIRDIHDSGLDGVIDRVLNLMSSYPAHVVTMGNNAVWGDSNDLFTFYFDSLPLCTISGVGVLNGLLKYVASCKYLHRCEFERVDKAEVERTYTTVRELVVFIDDYLAEEGCRVYVKPIHSADCFAMMSNTLNECKDWLRPMAEIFTEKTVPKNLRLAAKNPAGLFKFDVFDPVTKKVICTFTSMKTCTVYMGSAEAMTKALLGELDSSLGLKLHCCKEAF